MSILKKIKKVLNIYVEEEEIEPPEIPESKLKGFKFYAPNMETDVDSKEKYYVTPFDENYDIIKGVKANIKLADRIYHGIYLDDGRSYLDIGLRAKTWPIEVKCPNSDEFSPTVYSKIRVYKEDEERDEQPTTRLYAPRMKMYAHQEPDYLIRLTDNDDKPIPNEKVLIHIDEETHTLTTDKNGFASIFLELEEGIHPMTVEFKGNDEHDPVMEETEINVLIRSIDKEVMINIENLVMEFKVSKDKIDTLKEYVIRSLKRNKTKKQKIRVLDDISFKIYKGERMGILGFNGAGKSTLLKILAGIYEPTSGHIDTYGKIAPLLELGAGFDKNYTGENNIYLNGAFLSMTEDFIDSKYDEIVEFSELGEYIKYPVKNYSSGMRAKLGFSIATLVEPDILIVDEILSVGDIKFRKKSSEKLQSMMHDGVTVLLVSHSIEQIRSICDRCIWIENGKIVMEGEAEEVCDAYVYSAKSK